MSADPESAVISTFTVVLAGATIALVIVTGVLAWFTRGLVQVTKQTSQASEERKIMPKLVYNTHAQEPSGKCRFSVKNIGYGPAMNPRIKVFLNGKEVEATAVHPTNVITAPEGLYYWDIFDTKTGDKVHFEVQFENVNKKEMEPFKVNFEVEQPR